MYYEAAVHYQPEYKNLMTKSNNLLLPLDEEEKLKLLAECSLYEFYKQALPVIDGSGYFSDEWFLRVIAEHLENVYYRKITKLLINVPPRLGKTSLISIAFPAWVWKIGRAHV